MIVVSNTSPLTNLAAIGQFDLLRKLFGQIHIPKAVWHELNAGGVQYPGSPDVDEASWVRIHSTESSGLVAVLRRDLDAGESASLALALELQASIILLDEREARHAAASLGLQAMGVLGVLLQAKTRGDLSSIRGPMDALRNDAGFFVSDSLYKRMLDLAGESAG